MDKGREALLQGTIALFIRTAAILDLPRLQEWQRLGVTLPQLRILFRVRSHPRIDVRTLALAFGISPSAISQQVEKLVSRGLVRRSDDPDDRRHVSLELTELGNEAVGEISRATRSHVEPILSRLSDEELAELNRLLVRVAEAGDLEQRRPPVPVARADSIPA